MRGCSAIPPQQPGDPSPIERFEDEYRADPLGTAYTFGALLGTIAALVIQIVPR